MKNKIRFFILLFCFSYDFSFSQENKQPVDYVNVFTGTSNSRWMLFPGPTMPFGMVKLSPDNQTNVWNGGYEYTINSISGFSNIHSWSMAGLSIMPTTGEIRTFPGSSEGPFKDMWTAGFRSRFLKNEEIGKVGYYKVRLFDYDITTELTTTTRCGYMRMTFPQTDKANIMLNFNFLFEENNPEMRGAYLKKVSDTEVEGFIKNYSSFADEYVVHFVIRFSKPIDDVICWQHKPFKGNQLYGIDWQKENEFFHETEKQLHGECGAVIRFKTSKDEVVSLQSAISLVSIEQARLNLDTEMKPFGWDFDAVVKNNQDTWNKLLKKIDVETNIEDDKTKFYTNFYRAYASRTIWSDVNGKYTDMCENTQQLKAPADNIYGSDAFWGCHWNLFPLWTLITPSYANSWINSLLEMYDKGGWLPQAPEGVEYCKVMVGAHQIKLIVSAYQKGIRNFDVEKAWQAIKKNQTVPGIKHECGGWAGNINLDSFQKYGYVADEDGPVSNTLEIAFDDWAAAQLAKSLGKKNDYNYFIKQSQNYKNIFDPTTKFMRQRKANGDWVQNWDSLQNHGTWYGSGYVEGTAWHYSFFVPHDYNGLMKLVGKERFVNRLEQGFEKGYIDIGNQPNMQAPFIFNYAGKPWLTQKYARKCLSENFTTSPMSGWPGEEDQGQMGALYTLASMGLFEMDGGCAANPRYEITSPVYQKVTIHLDDTYYSGKDFVIEAHHNSQENIYIQSATLNGKPLTKPWFYHSDLIKGGKLILEMGKEPNKNWGSKPEDSPQEIN